MLGAAREQPLVSRCHPFLRVQGGVPPRGADGKNLPENRDMREAVIWGLQGRVKGFSRKGGLIRRCPLQQLQPSLVEPAHGLAAGADSL